MDENTFENQREAVKAIEEEEEAKKNVTLDDLKAQKEAEIKKSKDEVYQRLIMNQEDEAEMKAIGRLSESLTSIFAESQRKSDFDDSQFQKLQSRFNE